MKLTSIAIGVSLSMSAVTIPFVVGDNIGSSQDAHSDTATYYRKHLKHQSDSLKVMYPFASRRQQQLDDLRASNAPKSHH